MLRLKVLREVSDHSGYCSGNECDYDSETVEKTVPLTDLPNPCGIHPKVQNTCQSCLFHILRQHFEPPAPDPKKSMYCTNSELSREHELGVHDFKLTILDVEVVS